MEPWPYHTLGKASKAVWAQGHVLEQEAEVRSDMLSEDNSFRAPQRFFPPRPPPHKDFGAGFKAEVGLSLKHNSPTLFLLYPVLMGWRWKEQRFLEWAPGWTENQGCLGFVEQTWLHLLGSLLSFHFTSQSLSLLCWGVLAMCPRFHKGPRD